MAAFVLLGAGLRLHDIGAKPLWSDEIQSLRRAHGVHGDRDLPVGVAVPKIDPLHGERRGLGRARGCDRGGRAGRALAGAPWQVLAPEGDVEAALAARPWRRVFVVGDRMAAAPAERARAAIAAAGFGLAGGRAFDRLLVLRFDRAPEIRQ